MSDEDRYKQMIEEATQSQGFPVKSWEQDEDDATRPTANLGRFSASDDDDEAGIYGGTEGVVKASVVGAAEYNNERVAFYYYEEGMDEMTGEIKDFDILEPI